MSSLYVYGIVPTTASPPDGPGIDGEAVRRVDGPEISALVSELATEGIALGREAMTTHAAVLEQVTEQGPVLPMRFGIVLENEDELRRDLLDAHGDELRTQLAEFADKAELKLRAIYEEEPLMREIVTGNEEIMRLRTQLQDTPKEAAYYAEIRMGELVAEAIERTRDGDAMVILERLRPLAEELDVATPTHESEVLNASFLVLKERMEEFDEAVNSLGEEQFGRMSFRYTGPLPPHSFVHFERGA